MKKILVVFMMMVVGGAAALSMTPQVSAASWDRACESSDASAEAKAMANCDDYSGSGSKSNISKTVQNILNVIFGIAGICAVVAVIVGGQRLITAGGDPAKVAKAKNTILGAVIGIVVVLLSWAAVSFIATNVLK